MKAAYLYSSTVVEFRANVGRCLRKQPRDLRADSITKFAHIRGKDPLYFTILTLAWCDHYEYFKLYASSRSYPCWQAQLN